MRRRACLLAVLAAICAVVPAYADESGFLKPLNGNWTGAGKVLRKIGGPPINVSCKFTISAPGSSIAMKGNCRGLLIINRAISAQLTGRGSRYSGSRQGDVINLAVRWARLVSGDRDANMTIRRQGSGQLTLRTIDKDLSSGKPVVTSEINLRRQ